MEAKRIGIVHGLMHTKRRWEHLAGCFANAESIGLPMESSIEGNAKAIAPILEEYDLLIGHSLGGLVLHRAIEAYGAKKPQAIFYVSTPFRGIWLPHVFAPLLRVPKTRGMVKAFAKITVTTPGCVDEIMLDDVMCQDFKIVSSLYRELCRVRIDPVAIPGLESYNIVAGRDHVFIPSPMRGARNIIFPESGHTIPLEYEERFVGLVKHLGQTK